MAPDEVFCLQHDDEDDEDRLAPIFRGEDGNSTFDLGELDDLLADEKENWALSVLEDPPSILAHPATSPKPKSKKSKKAAAAAAAVAPKKAKKQELIRGPLAELDDLVLSDASAPASTKRKTGGNKKALTLTDAEAAEALGELTSLSAAEKAEKQARKRSLRFYTGQIASRDPYAPSSSSGMASGGGGKLIVLRGSGKGAQSGDADIPYTDRDRSRRAVEAAAEAKRARANG
ncbi:unnamed protein product, partial [Tilletia caries]